MSIVMSSVEFTAFILLGLLIICLNASALQTLVASFPLQFSANLQITSNLIEETSEYPPRHTRMAIFYDYINKMARVDIEAGYEAAKYYIRRHDKEAEYMVRLSPINDCKRAYLGEEMIFPDLSDVVHAGEALINDIDCNYFLHEDFDSRVHMYFDKSSNAPVQLVQESIEGGQGVVLLTYDYSDVVLGSPDKQWFELPQEHQNGHDCVRHTAGFPYLHVFHYFVRI